MVEVADNAIKRVPGQPQAKKRVLRRTVGPCEGCEMHDLLGCGWLGKRSSGRPERVKKDLPDVWHTCPEYYARQPAVYEAYEYYADYKRGGLGNVLKLPSVLLDALRVLDAENNEFEARLNE